MGNHITCHCTRSVTLTLVAELNHAESLHTVVITFTSVKFLLSLPAFTEVVIDDYTDKKFTQVSKLCYCSKKLKCKHGISSLREQNIPIHCSMFDPCLRKVQKFLKEKALNLKALLHFFRKYAFD